MPMNNLKNIKRQLDRFKPVDILDGFEIAYDEICQRDVRFRVPAVRIILSAREGELIEEVNDLPRNFSYALTYPGSASTKCMVIFTSKSRGIFIGGEPTFEYARITIRKIEQGLFEISYSSKENRLVFLPFEKSWKEAADTYKQYFNIYANVNTLKRRKPIYLLQIGIKNRLGNCGIISFDDLMEPVDYFEARLGAGHIIHLIGANQAGFDSMFPQFKVNDDLGGEEGLRGVLDKIKSKGLLTSHHFNPRIADYDWIQQHAECEDAIVRDTAGYPVAESYGGHPYYVMNPNHPIWFDACMQTIQRLHAVGFDYVQLDQFTQQRNLYDPKQPIQLGYAKMVRQAGQLGIRIWLEGVSDVYRLDGMGFSQILVRERPALFTDFELATGYPYGKSCPEFFMYLYPDHNISYRVMTDVKTVENFKQKLAIARKIHAMVYDLQMDFLNDGYMKLLEDAVDMILKYS